MSTILLLLSSILIAAAIYRLFRRNPRLPPGPTPWPVLGNLPHLGAKPHQSLAALAQKHGPLMRLRLGSVEVVVAASAAVASQFLKTHDLNFSSRPPNSGAKHIAYNYQDLVFAPYGARWRMLRKICSLHLFSAKALDDFRHVRQAEVKTMTRNIVTCAATPVNLGRMLNICTTNALSRVMLSRPVFSDDEKADEFKEMVVEIMVLAGVFNIGDFVPALDRFDLQGVVAKMKRLHSRFDSFLDRIIDDHSNSPDLLSTLLSLDELTRVEIKALLLNLFAAGTDTSSSTTEWAIAELIKNPDLLTRVRDELDSVVGSNRVVNESDLPDLPFLHAVIKETFRLHPSTPLSLPRIAEEACEVNEYHIPKGATLLVNVWAIARDPEQWVDPMEFRPNRFLPGGEKPNVDVKGNDFEVIPFGAGRRICAGLSLGLRMVQFMTATLVHAFDWQLPDGQLPEKLNMEEAYGLTLQRAVPLKLIAAPRLSPGAFK